MRRTTRGRERGAAVAAGGILLLLATLGLPASPASAEEAWVRGEVRLNLRTGPSTGHRIVGGVKTGDRVEILERGEDWTRVRVGDEVGWIPGGYLNPEPPPAVRVEGLERELAELREQVTTLRGENQRLAERAEEAVAQQTSQRAKLDRALAENRELKAGARWPHWITGAAILALGVVLGAILLALPRPGRRAQRRIKL